MRSMLLTLAVLGCGGGGGGDSIKVNAANAKLAAVNSGGAWTPLTMTAAGDATVELDGPTIIAEVCDDGDYFDYYTIHTGPGGEDLNLECAGTQPSFTLTVTTAPTTVVAIGFDRTTTTSKTLSVRRGVYDLVAIDTTTKRFEIRRDIDVSADAAIVVDLAATGMPMTPITVNVTGAVGDETVSRYHFMNTANRTFAFWSTTTTDSVIIPPAMLRADDRQSVSASTSGAAGTRAAHHQPVASESSVTLALPPYLTSVTPSPTGVTWQGDAAHDAIYYGINSPGFDILWDMSIEPAWADAGGATQTLTFPDPHAIPGWQAAWDLGATTDYEFYFSAGHTSGRDSVSVTKDGPL